MVTENTLNKKRGIIREEFSKFAQTQFCHDKMFECMVDLVEANAAFNAWISIEVKDRRADMMDILDFYEEIENDIKCIISELYANKNELRFLNEIDRILARFRDAQISR